MESAEVAGQGYDALLKGECPGHYGLAGEDAGRDGTHHPGREACKRNTRKKRSPVWLGPSTNGRLIPAEYHLQVPGTDRVQCRRRLYVLL